MSFDIARTPTLEAVATEDEQRLVQDLQKRVEESIHAAESREDVMAAVESQRAAAEKLDRFRHAERALTRFAKSSREQAAAAMEGVLDAVIESAEKPDFKKLSGLISIEHQNQFAMRAIERLVEHLIPIALMASLREESHALLTRARAVEGIAQERAERVLGQVRDAVCDEMVLPIDLSKGVSGALLAHANGLKRVAMQVSQNADELERSYSERRKR
jgi:hypothetical protein